MKEVSVLVLSVLVGWGMHIRVHIIMQKWFLAMIYPSCV